MEGKNPKRRKRWQMQRPWNGQARRTRPGRTDPGWRTKKWDAQWCGKKVQGTAQPQTIQKDRQEYGPDGKENGGWKTTSYQSGGREGGTWYKGFGNKATPSSRKPNMTDAPGRDTISGQTKRCSTPNYLPSTERFGKRRKHDQEYTIFVDSQAAMKRCLTDHQGPGQETARPLSGGVRALRDGKHAAAAGGPQSHGAMKLPIEWPRRQQRANSIPTAVSVTGKHGLP